MATLYADRVRTAVTTTGTGTINLGIAISGFRTFDAAATAGSLASGCTVYYTIEDVGFAWETGSGIYTAGSPSTLTRVLAASSTGSLLSLSGNAQVYINQTAASILLTAGPIGPIGLTGSTGSTGPAGPTGPTGPPMTISVGTLTASTSTTTITPGTYTEIDVLMTASSTFTISAGVNKNKLMLAFTQDGTGSRLVTLGSGFLFGSDTSSFVASTTPNKTDFVGLEYSSTASGWFVLSYARGY